ncbi:FkbM family methyltransferase [Vibrio metschnikovii]|uniref:FkbM family methyltransferase n=1 Tax=Vibrio metschnikovii TaxID=28172 RepID=UPI00375352AF
MSFVIRSKFIDNLNTYPVDGFHSQPEKIENKIDRRYYHLVNINWYKNYIANNLDVKNGLFIDCGGYDGCSVIKYLSQNPTFDAVTFEPNPELWKYYKNIPTKLIKKAVYSHNRKKKFIIDPFDYDGSTLIKQKMVDFHQRLDNKKCPSIVVECIDLSRFINDMSKEYSIIVLKLDVEGAEYDILEKLIKDKTIDLVYKIYAEFHWKKMNMEIERHQYIYDSVSLLMSIDFWDAKDYSIHRELSI